MTVVIRLATEADVPDIRDLLVRTWHNTYDTIYGVQKVTEITDNWHSIGNLTRQLDRPLSLFLVVKNDEQLLGTLKTTSLGDGTVMLDRLYIDPIAQRLGVGTSLLDFATRAYPLATRMNLEVELKNDKAVKFYKKHGFEPDGATSDCGGSSGISANRMTKVLRGKAPDVASDAMIRPVLDRDAQDLIGLITLCFAEYPGQIFDPHDDMPDIIKPSQSRLAKEGQFLAVEDARGRICACVGVDFANSSTAELHRLYVRPDKRGLGLGRILTERMEAFARSKGATSMILWSDVRFRTAHSLYGKMGYQRGAASRALGDLSHSREFFFEKTL